MTSAERQVAAWILSDLRHTRQLIQDIADKAERDEEREAYGYMAAGVDTALGNVRQVLADSGLTASPAWRTPHETAKGGRARTRPPGKGLRT